LAESGGEIPEGFVLAGLMAQIWPGNMRELKNHAARLAMGLLEGEGAGETSLAKALEQVETHLITQALKKHNSRITEVCATLGLPRKTLYDKMKRLQIDPAAFR